MRQDQGSRIKDRGRGLWSTCMAWATRPTAEGTNPEVKDGPEVLNIFTKYLYSFSAAQLICFCTSNALMHTNALKTSSAIQNAEPAVNFLIL